MNLPAHEHSHSTNPETCPYCGHPVTREEFLAIEARLAQEQKAKFDAQARALRAKHLDELSELRKSSAEKERALDEHHKRELKGKDDAREKAVGDALKIARREWETASKADKASIAQERQVLARDRKTFETEKAAAKKAHEEVLAHDRKVLNVDFEKKLLAQRAASDKVLYRTQQKLEDVQRQLEKKSNDELGDGAEVVLYNDLKRVFPPADLIERVKRGVSGADIKHEIYVDGRFCGKIVYDSKNRGDWKEAYAEQLRQDQIAEKADYAILATRKFPRDAKEMTERNGVILVNPARACVVASVLRKALVHLSSTKLSEEGRREKQRELYTFITSSQCSALFARVEEKVASLRKQDEDERKQQETVRGHRAKTVSEIEKIVLGEIYREIQSILGI